MKSLEILTIISGLAICLHFLLKISSVSIKNIDKKVEASMIGLWNRYWFAPTSLRRLAIFRILIFGFLTYYSFTWIGGYVEGLKHASPEFFKPLLLIKVLHLSPPTPFIVDIVHFLLILFAVGGMIGFMTRFCVLGSLIFFVYIIGMWWSFEGVHHSEPVFIFALTALALSPCGRVVSVDEVLSRMRVSKRSGEFQRNRAGRLESEYALWPIRLVQVLIAAIYFNSGYWKLKLAGLSWAGGVPLQFHLIRHYFSGQYISNIGFIISKSLMLCKILSVFTLVFELGFPLVLVFPRLAWIWLPVGVCFHLGTGFMMDTWFYPLWFCYVAFINFETVGQWLRDRFGVTYNSREVKVLFDGACPLCIRSMTLIACLDWLRRIEFLDLNNWDELSKSYPKLNREDCLREMYVIDQKSQIYKGFYAYRRLAKVIPVFWITIPFLYIPGISLIGNSIYRFIANRRARNAVACTIHNCR